MLTRLRSGHARLTRGHLLQTRGHLLHGDRTPDYTQQGMPYRVLVECTRCEEEHTVVILMLRCVTSWL